MIRVEVPVPLTDQLNRGSVSKRCYPWDQTVVDWSVPIDEDHDYMPSGFSFLDGTRLGERLSARERSYITRWEFTRLMRNQTQGEHILNQALLGILYHIDPYDPAYRYILHEITEESQHMAMFNQWVRYNPDIRTHGLGQDQLGTWISAATPVVATRFPALLWMLTYLFEVFGDQMARSAAADPNPNLHPIVRQLMKAHVIEEARHVTFAREWLESLHGKMSPLGRRALSRVAEEVLGTVLRLNFPFVPLLWSEQIRPWVPRKAFRRAMQSEHRRRLIQAQVGAAALVLRDIGILRERTLSKWDHSGFLPRAYLTRKPVFVPAAEEAA